MTSALAPTISARTIFTMASIIRAMDSLNKLLAGTEFADCSSSR
jgi:hypothetical protein